MEVIDALRHSRGQALIEFALATVLLSMLLGGTIEFGFIFGHKIELNNAARSGARWAASNSHAWSYSPTPPSNSIEGQVRLSGGTTTIPNDDTHISIQYYDNSKASPVLCGHYSAAASSFVAEAGYSQATCATKGNLVTVTVSNAYPLFANLLPVAPLLSSHVTFEVMN